MRLADFAKNSYLNLGATVALAFATSYLLAGIIALRVLNTALEDRVLFSTQLTAEQFEDRYLADGEAGLVTAIEAKLKLTSIENEIIWLGSRDGSQIAGVPIVDPMALASGRVKGGRIGGDIDDDYALVIRPIGQLHLIIGESFDEAEDLQEYVFHAFGFATLAGLVLAILAATRLASTEQRRLGQIADTLKTVARGDFRKRVDESGRRDDLYNLAVRVNEALSLLEANVEGVKQVSSSIAHDLRTPISRLGITLDKMQEFAIEQSHLDTLMNTAKDQINDITAIFDALLRIAQIESGSRKAKFTPINLSDIVGDLGEVYAPVVEEAEQYLHVTEINEANSAFLVGDKRLLTQMLANLVENSIRHCPTGTNIYLDFGANSTSTWVSVSDDGPGIDKTEHDRVVTRFFRIEKARGSIGAGLGLALVKAIAELHGAELNLEDCNPGLRVLVRFESSTVACR